MTLLMRDEENVRKGMEKGIVVGEKRGIAVGESNIILKMGKSGYSAEQIAEMTGEPVFKIADILRNLSNYPKQ